MLDITSYRRKQKYSKPLTVMRQLYHEYADNHKPKTSSIIVGQDPLARRTLSVQKFNRCLRSLQEESIAKKVQQNCGLSKEKQNIKNQSSQNLQCRFLQCKSTSRRQNNQKRGNLLITSRGNKENIINQADKQQIDKRAFFKSMFSSTLPFFSPHSSILIMRNQRQRNNTQKIDSSQKLETKKSLISNILFERKDLQMRNPTTLFKQMMGQKQIMEDRFNQKKSKLRKLRHDWIVGNLYQKNQQQGVKLFGRAGGQRQIYNCLSSKQNMINLPPKMQDKNFLQ